jgi:two-component system chemotaxis sensor kinase CheA
MPDGDVWQLIFEAGFSTAENVTDVSGRGVGMDVVKRNIQALGGRVEIQSTFGVGTRISIRVPLTLAILDGMSVAVGGEVFIIPLTAIVESLQPHRSNMKSVQGQGQMVQVRGEFLPVVALHEVFGIRAKAATIEEAIFVILETDGMKKAVMVDELLGQHQVVIKSLETNYRKTPGVSAATIMGDGRVALILDVATLIRKNTGGLRAAA